MVDAHDPSRPVDRPPPWLVLARGAAYGVASGGAFGLALMPVAAVILFLDDPTERHAIALTALLAGVLGVLFGMLFGLVGGFGAALGLLLLPAPERPIERLVAGLMAAMIVAIMSWVTFQPGLRSSVDVPRSEIVERLAFFYVYPCLGAVIAGYVIAPRLVAPRVSWMSRMPTAT